MAFRSGVPDFTRELTVIINEDDPETIASFTVPQGVLTEHSDFFQAACHDDSGEVVTTIKLPQVDPDIFRAYLFWVYRGEIAFTTDFAQQSVSGSDLYPTSLALGMLWLLADRLTTAKLRNNVMEALQRVLAILDHTQGNPTDIFPPSMIEMIWPATTVGRSLRKLVVDYYATKVPIPVIEQHFEECHPEFIRELMRKIIEIHQSTEINHSIPEVNSDHHHVHQSTEANATAPQVNGDHLHAHKNAESDDPTSKVNGGLQVNGELHANGDHHHEGAPSQPRPVDPAAQHTNAPAARSTASIILKDRLGNILYAQSALFFTPDRFVSAILPKLQGQTTSGDKQAPIEVALQFPNNASQPVDRSEWSKSFGQIVIESGQPSGRGTFAFTFNGGSFTENMGYTGILDHQIPCPPR